MSLDDLTGIDADVRAARDELDGYFGVDLTIVRQDGTEIAARALKPNVLDSDLISASGRVIPRGALELSIRLSDTLAVLTQADRIVYREVSYRVVDVADDTIGPELYGWTVRAVH
jgi:hypothetical protein